MAPLTLGAYMETFLAIDFETANARRASACALGWVLYEAGERVDAGSFLIDPQIADGEWDGFNIGIHGITPDAVRGARTFGDVWSWVAPHAAVGPLIAHNAAFDLGVVRAELLRARITPDPFKYLCSARLAREAWPEMLSVSLSVVAAALQIPLNHHDPASDASACGEILLAAVRAIGADTIDSALRLTSRQWGEVRGDLSWLAASALPLKAASVSASTEVFDEAHPLFGRVVVFTGALDCMTRREAFQVIANLGGKPGDGVTKHTNILVCGDQDISKLAAGHEMSHKFEKASRLREKGMDIELIGETEFRRLL
jgi:DNA polymerase III epsilon subunit-like protein